MSSLAYDNVMREALGAYVATQMSMQPPGGQQHQPMDVDAVKGKQKGENGKGKGRNLSNQEGRETKARARARARARAMTPPATSLRGGATIVERMIIAHVLVGMRMNGTFTR